MSYLRVMTRVTYRTVGILAAVSILLTLASCRAAAVYGGPGDVADEFYSHQLPGSTEAPASLFQDENTRQKVLEEISMRSAANGEFQSQKKVGSNLQVNFGQQGREETLVYIFEVSSSGGKTRETLVLKRGRKTEAYKISSYQVENIQRVRDNTQMSTSSA